LCSYASIYFSDRLYSEEELPPEFKLFLPIQKQQQQAAPVAQDAAGSGPESTGNDNAVPAEQEEVIAQQGNSS